MAFLQARERFISIRGAPARMIGYNATCFRGADNEMRQLYKAQLQANGLRFRIEWEFGPPGGLHHQGTVERMVQEKKSKRQ
jgi:hypothetical protein